MRREGRQRGMIRTLPILQYDPRPNPRRTLNEMSAPPTAGAFTKAPSKPTNHSKFTGKCARPLCRDCHVEPACKSKDKAKGAHKPRSAAHKPRSPLSDLGAKPSRYSASGIVDYLHNIGCDSDHEYDDGGGWCDSDCDSEFHGYNTTSFGHVVDSVAAGGYGSAMSFGDVIDAAVAAVDDDDTMSFGDIINSVVAVHYADEDTSSIGDIIDDGDTTSSGDNMVDGVSDQSSFCEVGFVSGSMDGDEEGWCLVQDLS